MSDTITLIQRSQQGDRDASERLVTENTGLIWSIARRYFGRGVEPDDLFQLGCVGFLKAVEGFDTAYGTQFSTYAVPKIAGEIRRFLRDDGAVKVSRSVKERAAAIKKARERLTGDFGRDPTVSELSEALGLSPEEATGRGAGLSDAGLARKRNAVARALDINRPRADDPLDSLAKVGGFEIAAMTGAFLGGAEHRVPVVIDGVISAAAALAAARIRPEAREFMLPSHMSREPAALRIMEELHFSPILHADMALGEGAGAVALFPLLDMALCVYRGTHTFDALGIGAYTRQEGTK